ncbi:MAG: V-type ATP synthase subunit F [Desulfoferrobacter sp.]
MKIAVLTDPESAAGYRLAGLEAAVANDATAAREVLVGLIEQGIYALIAVNEDLLPDPYQAVKKEMRSRDLPILLVIPSLPSAMADQVEEAEEYMQQLIIKTIGYEIKLKP